MTADKPKTYQRKKQDNNNLFIAIFQQKEKNKKHCDAIIIVMRNVNENVNVFV